MIRLRFVWFCQKVDSFYLTPAQKNESFGGGSGKLSEESEHPVTDSNAEISFQLIPRQTYQTSVSRGAGQPSASQISSGARWRPKIAQTIFSGAPLVHICLLGLLTRSRLQTTMGLRASRRRSRQQEVGTGAGSSAARRRPLRRQSAGEKLSRSLTEHQLLLPPFFLFFFFAVPSVCSKLALHWRRRQVT